MGKGEGPLAAEIVCYDVPLYRQAARPTGQHSAQPGRKQNPLS
jgi:hypothetical protein